MWNTRVRRDSALGFSLRGSGAQETQSKEAVAQRPPNVSDDSPFGSCGGHSRVFQSGLVQSVRFGSAILSILSTAPQAVRHMGLRGPVI